LESVLLSESVVLLEDLRYNGIEHGRKSWPLCHIKKTIPPLFS